MAVKDGRIVAVGGPELADRFIATVTRDLEGQTVLPGFDDVHSHIHSYARRYIPLQKITSIEALKDAVQAKAEALGPGEWITGYGWSRTPLRRDASPTETIWMRLRQTTPCSSPGRGPQRCGKQRRPRSRRNHPGHATAGGGRD